MEVKKRSGMREVAQQANLSIATVSRALRDPGSVSEKSLSRVEEAARAVGYTYNAAAGDLLAGRSTVLGVLVPSVANSLFGSTLNGVQDAALDARYSIIQGVTNWDPSREEKLLETLLSRRIHGLVLTGFTDSMRRRLEDAVVENAVRTVVIWEKPRKGKLSYVGFDNLDAARRATDYLIGLGHRRIGLLTGPGSITARARHRFEGYAAALEAAGIPFDPEIALERLPGLNDGREAMSALMSVTPRPTAVFAASDILAIGALRAAHELKLRVPEDVSIVGFDDLEIAAFQHPPLTTVRVPGYRIGALAAQIAMEARELPLRQYCLDSDLVLRSSSGPPAEKGT